MNQSPAEMPEDPRPTDDVPSQVNDGLRQVIAENLKWWRATRGWSQEQLAVKAGLTRETVRGVENATNDARLSTLDQLSGALKVAAEWLVSERDLEQRQRAAEEMGWTVEPARQLPLVALVSN